MISPGNDKKNKGKRFFMQNECDSCAFCAYDEEYGGDVCEIDMDEDEYARFLTDSHYSCPYYRNGDEYAVVRHQM